MYVEKMLQEYHRQTTIKPFAPILKDRTTKRWDNEISLPTNISLLSISTSSKHSENDDDENDINIHDHSNSRASTSSPESVSAPPIDETDENQEKHDDLDPYIFNKHINGISSSVSNLVESDIDKSVYNLFDENKSAYQWKNDDFNPRAIRPPAFSQHIKQIKESQTKTKSIQRRSARIPVRTTKAEKLKLIRQQSASQTKSDPPRISSSTVRSPNKSPTKSAVRNSRKSPTNNKTRSRSNSNGSIRQSESTKSCKLALNSNAPLHLSAMLVKQMRQDIKSNRVPAYSKALSSALLREQPYPPLTHQYKMRRIHHWLEKVHPTDCIEYNELASIESTIGTKLNDKLDDENDLLADEKRGNNVERTYEEAHRALPLFKAEIHRKMQHHDLLLTRLELDLYVI